MENMFADVEEMRARCRSTPTIAERRESESSSETSEMRISHNGPIVVDVGVQVNMDSVFQFPSNPYDYSNRSPPQSRSVPQSPYNHKGNSSRGVSWGKMVAGPEGDKTSLLQQRPNGRRKRYTNMVASSPQLNTLRTNGHFSELQEKGHVSREYVLW